MQSDTIQKLPQNGIQNLRTLYGYLCNIMLGMLKSINNILLWVLKIGVPKSKSLLRLLVKLQV